MRIIFALASYKHKQISKQASKQASNKASKQASKQAYFLTLIMIIVDGVDYRGI
jgi:hypothetical protein